MSKIAALALLAALAAPGIVLAAPGGDPAADQDRYGPPAAPFIDPASPDAAQATLTWPGKAPAAPHIARPVALQAYAPPPYPAAAAPIAAVTLPTSLYAPPPSPLSQPAASTQTAAAGQPARFYSLHREFGLAPDPAPAPLPTQFFTPSADLAEPPPPPPPHVLPAGQQAMTASARARADASDPDAAPATLDNTAP